MGSPRSIPQSCNTARSGYDRSDDPEEITMTRPDDAAPDADVAEQATPANPDEDTDLEPTMAFEANEADVLEQEKVVDVDDEY